MTDVLNIPPDVPVADEDTHDDELGLARLLVVALPGGAAFWAGVAWVAVQLSR